MVALTYADGFGYRRGPYFGRTHATFPSGCRFVDPRKVLEQTRNRLRTGVIVPG